MAAITSQWWRRLVNAYEVKARMVRLQHTVKAETVVVCRNHNSTVAECVSADCRRNGTRHIIGSSARR